MPLTRPSRGIARWWTRKQTATWEISSLGCFEGSIDLGRLSGRKGLSIWFFFVQSVALDYRDSETFNLHR